jgi:hypothetical protein
MPTENKWIKKIWWYIHTMDYYSTFKKEGNPAMCDMYEPGAFKLNKLVTRTKTNHDSTSRYLK